MNNGHFTYDRSWEQIEAMLDKAERKQNFHSIEMSKNISKKEKIFHMRQFKALEGVIKSLRWVLGDKNIQHPLE
tara:strand:+ start:258 stop:479 length:222 start_codon:yes stop_codon:yes gene_type:complete